MTDGAGVQRYLQTQYTAGSHVMVAYPIPRPGTWIAPNPVPESADLLLFVEDDDGRPRGYITAHV